MTTKLELPPLNWLRAFESTARLGSFTRAADEMCLTQSAISQHTNNLENHLGTRLFVRRSRGVELTDTGRAYLPTVQEAFQRLESGTRELFGNGEQSVLTIKAGVTFIHQCLLPRLSSFERENPSIKLRLHATVWPDKFAGEREIEIEIKHLNEDVQDDGEKLTDEFWHAMASPKLIKKLGEPKPQDLVN